MMSETTRTMVGRRPPTLVIDSWVPVNAYSDEGSAGYHCGAWFQGSVGCGGSGLNPGVVAYVSCSGFSGGERSEYRESSGL